MEASSELNNQKCQSAPLQKVNEKIKDTLRDMLNHKEIMDYLIKKAIS